MRVSQSIQELTKLNEITGETTSSISDGKLDVEARLQDASGDVSSDYTEKVRKRIIR